MSLRKPGQVHEELIYFVKIQAIEEAYVSHGRGRQHSSKWYAGTADVYHASILGRLDCKHQLLIQRRNAEDDEQSRVDGRDAQRTDIKVDPLPGACSLQVCGRSARHSVPLRGEFS